MHEREREEEHEPEGGRDACERVETRMMDKNAETLPAVKTSAAMTAVEVCVPRGLKAAEGSLLYPLD